MKKKYTLCISYNHSLFLVSILISSIYKMLFWLDERRVDLRECPQLGWGGVRIAFARFCPPIPKSWFTQEPTTEEGWVAGAKKNSFCQKRFLRMAVPIHPTHPVIIIRRRANILAGSFPISPFLEGFYHHRKNAIFSLSLNTFPKVSRKMESARMFFCFISSYM